MSEETNVEVNVEEAQAAASAASPDAQGPDLTVQDLQALKSIIDVASQRGAFKPNEMMTVGQTYGKLETFLEAVSQQQPEQGA
tara:strand:+ start:860 stop:1108 length:249 start_codon:yes stop_codon:yes gene_type:complete